MAITTTMVRLDKEVIDYIKDHMTGYDSMNTTLRRLLGLTPKVRVFSNGWIKRKEDRENALREEERLERRAKRMSREIKIQKSESL